MKKKKSTEERKIFWAERRGDEQRGASQREKGETMDWTWEDNEEWNTVQQNVISQTVVWGALLPFQWDCYYRWISPTKTFNSSGAAFPGFCSDRGRLWKPGFESGQSVSPNEAALASRWRLNRKRAHISLDQDCLLWTFLISADIQISKEKMPLWLCRLPSQLPVVKLINQTQIICFHYKVFWTGKGYLWFWLTSCIFLQAHIFEVIS